jgi:transcription initiation factor TFIID subunit 11
MGDIIDQARQVQLEWQAASTRLPTGEELPEDAPLADRTRDYDRGPLTPDHLREALRRYKKERSGGSAGFLGLSLHGKDVVNARIGGRRLFK